MEKNKTLEELEAQYQKAERELQQNQRKLNLIENQVAYIRSRAQKKRTHRLITKGAAFESHFPESKCLTEMEFLRLIEELARLDFMQRKVSEAAEQHRWLAKQSGTDEENEEGDDTT